MDQLESKLKDILSGLQLDIMDQFRQISKVQEAPLKRVVTRQLSDKDAYVIALGDAHLGSMFCNEELFKATVNFILNTPNVYTILLGDLAETATRTSIGLGIFDEKYHIDKQLDVIVELLKPLADAGKILGMVTGNHEFRVHAMSAVDPSKVIADRLGVEYFGYQAYYCLKVGGQTYSLVAWHGAGGSCNKVSQMKAAEKLKETILADIYISGHTHDRSYHDDDINLIQDGELKRHRRHYVACGSYLEASGGYAEMKGLSPAATGGVIIKLHSDKKDVTVTY